MLYRAFTVTECPRCPDLILVGVVGGVRYRIDRRTIPTDDAAVLRRYGVPILVLDRGVDRLDADWWVPEQHDLSKSGRHLVVPHVCSSAHAARPTARRVTPSPFAIADDNPPY
ncbi:hypothetical protein ACFP2T_16375 [Plantactinospora solaniradicis]|uniref:Uncharacterized protein n=1 Tax=Plantactinospora solaniradicis TaxID=1723736 RepID=A0ABW1KAF6_9ACTN